MGCGPAVGHASIFPHRSGIAHSAADHSLDADPRAVFIANERLCTCPRGLQTNGGRRTLPDKERAAAIRRHRQRHNAIAAATPEPSDDPLEVRSKFQDCA
jgi:hypothetical protein